MKTLLKVKFQVFTIQLVSLLERNFALLSWNFWSNCSSKFLLVAGSERLDSKASPSKTSKTSKDQKKLFVSGLQMAVLKKLKMFKENVGTVLQQL